MKPPDHTASEASSPGRWTGGVSGWLVTSMFLLAGFVAFIFLQKSPDHQADRKQAPQRSSSTQLKRPSKDISKAPSGPTDQERIAAYNEARRRVDEAERNAAEIYRSHKDTFTPEVRARLVDSEMKFRRAGYEALFDEWKVPRNVRDEVLKSIHAREQTSMDNILDYTGGGAQDRKGLQTKDLINDGVAELELKALLGEEHFRQLNAHEKKLDQEAQERRMSARRPGG